MAGVRNTPRALDVLVEALAGIETSRAKLYLRLVLASLPQLARHHLDELMTAGANPYRFEGQLFDELRNKGAVRAKIEGVLAFLDARGIAVSEDAAGRVSACTDLAQLNLRVRRAATVETVDDLFA